MTMRADSLEDAARSLAKRVAARLAPEETAQVTARNLSSLARADAARAQNAFEQALRKRIRNATAVPVAFTISENLKGFILVASVKEAIEMEAYRPAPSTPAARPALTLEKKMLWQQDAPVLDAEIAGDAMLVLDSSGVTRYERREAKWVAAETAAAPTTVRDPRGRVTLSDQSLVVDLPGETCQGTWKPLALRCDSGGVISPGRNTFDGTLPFFSDARIGGARLIAETDGRIHIGDGTIENWGSDIAAMATCAGPRVAATANGDRETGDSIALYDLIQAVPIRVSDPAEFSGPVTALWPRQDGALAVVRNLTTHQYEAFELTADCGR